MDFVIWPDVFVTGNIPEGYCREVAVADCLMCWATIMTGHKPPDNWKHIMANLSVQFNFNPDKDNLSVTADEIIEKFKQDKEA